MWQLPDNDLEVAGQLAVSTQRSRLAPKETPAAEHHPHSFNRAPTRLTDRDLLKLPLWVHAAGIEAIEAPPARSDRDGGQHRAQDRPPLIEAHVWPALARRSGNGAHGAGSVLARLATFRLLDPGHQSFAWLQVLRAGELVIGPHHRQLFESPAVLTQLAAGCFLLSRRPGALVLVKCLVEFGSVETMEHHLGDEFLQRLSQDERLAARAGEPARTDVASLFVVPWTGDHPPAALLAATQMR